MTHLRLWRFAVAPENEARFVAAYGRDGDWAKLFATAPGFIRTELWRDEDGGYLTADFWQARTDFDHFRATHGEPYRSLDAQLAGIARAETSVGAFDSVD